MTPTFLQMFLIAWVTATVNDSCAELPIPWLPWPWIFFTKLVEIYLFRNKWGLGRTLYQATKIADYFHVMLHAMVSHSHYESLYVVAILSFVNLMSSNHWTKFLHKTIFSFAEYDTPTAKSPCHRFPVSETYGFFHILIVLFLTPRPYKS